MNCLENKNPYDLTDKAIDLLNRRAVKRFEDAKDEAALAKFDELNVLEVTRTLYDQLRKDNQDVFLELAQERYQEAEPHGKEPPDLAWLLALLAAYNAVTKYQYSHEWERKRDRKGHRVSTGPFLLGADDGMVCGGSHRPIHTESISRQRCSLCEMEHHE